MRRLFFVLLIALLPLRGWAGDAMAIGMAAGMAAGMAHAANSIAMQKDAAMASSHSYQKMHVEMPADCPMHAQVAEQTANGTSGTANAACTGCDTCALCLAMLIASAALPAPALSVPQAVTSIRGDGFASADLLRGLKPPIS